MIELNKIYLGNAYDLIKNVKDKSVDLIIVDPPYDFMSKQTSKNYSGGGAFGVKNRDYHGELETANIASGFDYSILDEFMRIMKKVNIYIWCNKEQISYYLNYFKDYNFDLLTWHKTNPVPTCNNKYLSDTEYLLFFRESGVKVYGTYDTKSKYWVTPTNKKDKQLYNHSTIKPLDIIKNLIINSSNQGDIVFDAFMGSGTTAVACKQLDRNFLGFELNESYHQTAIARLNETTNDVKNEQLSLFDM